MYSYVQYIFTEGRQVIVILVAKTLEISALKKIGHFANVVSIEKESWIPVCLS
jgi:hypothetical protein